MTRDLSDNRWIQTLKGRPFYLFDPKPEDFDIEEIAHALAMQCRFTGHMNQFYSIAEHSVLVSYLLEEWGESPSVVFCGLMHDAAEAYTGDLSRPLKRCLPDYKDIETLIEAQIAERFGIQFPFPDVIKKADTVMLLTERRDLLAPSPRDWSEEQAGFMFLGEKLELPGWTIGVARDWIEAKRLFLERFELLKAEL